MFSLDDIKRFVITYNPEGIIVDTNILILFLIGSYDPDSIENCGIINNSNKKYSKTDFEFLKEIFTFFKKLIITPQIIAELSNISITGGNMHGEKLTSYLQIVIKFLKSAEERHQKADCLWGIELKIIQQYGFTDLTMFELSKQTKMPILTDDHPFYVFCFEKIPIIKFEHIKNSKYQSILN